MPLKLSGSTGISGLDGSAGSPVYAGANANTGMYVSGSNVYIAVNGTQAVTVSNNGLALNIANTFTVANTVITNTGITVAGSYISQYSGMMKNRIINGDFKIDQRFAGAGNNNISGAQYVVDRWYSQGTSAGKLRFQQNNTNGPGSAATQAATGFPNYFGANVVSSNTVNSTDFWLLSQPIEGLNVADLGWGTANAQPVTISFWVYSSIAGTHGGTLVNGGGGGSRSYPFTYTVSTANTWQQQVITIPGDTSGQWYTNNNIGMSLSYDLGVGSSYKGGTTGIWQTGGFWPSNVVAPVSAANGSFYLTGVQLEEGRVATPFDFRHYTTELQLCQRYYIRRTSGATNGIIFPGGQQSAANSLITDFLPVSLRAVPTFSWDGTTSNWYIIVNNSTVALSSLTLSTVSNLQVMWISAGCSTTATYATWLAAQTSSAWLAYSAELGVQN